MNIVVTDGHTLNPGDLSWDELEKLGKCEIYKQTAPEQTVDRCKDADIVFPNKVVFDKQTLNELERLKCICVLATGYNVIDVAAAKDRGVIVCNIPTYGTASVAQMVFALLLELSHHTGYHAETVKQGKWSACENFCYWDRPLIELAGLTMGIVGLGRIGRATAALAKAFGMKVMAHDPFARQSDTDIQMVELDKLFSQSDVVSLHCPLTDDNKEMINSDRLRLMKPSALVINTSRGPLVNEQDLANALNDSVIAGAGLDVLSSEPPDPDNPLMTAKNCYITPHIAWATRSARWRLMKTAIENAKAFIQGKPENVVG